MIRILKVLAYTFLFMLLSSCGASKITIDASEGLTNKFVVNDLIPLVKYDPYSATVYFDHDEVQRAFVAYKIKMSSMGCSVTPRYMGNEANKDLWCNMFFKLDKYDNKVWTKQIYEQLFNNHEGWAIAQLKYPIAGLQHGDYSVECLVQFNIKWWRKIYGNDRRIIFTVKNIKEENKVQSSQNTKHSVIGINHSKCVANDWTSNYRIITKVFPNLPADSAGIKVNDIITHVNGRSTKDLKSSEIVNLFNWEIGAPITLTIIQEGQTIPRDYIFFSKSTPVLDNNKTSKSNIQSSQTWPLDEFGLTFRRSEPLDYDLQPYTKGKYIISSILSNSFAEKVGLKPNDLITHIDGKPSEELSATEISKVKTLTILQFGQTTARDYSLINKPLSPSLHSDIDSVAKPVSTSKPVSSSKPVNAPKSVLSPIDKLKQLKEMYNNELITKDEYDQKRKAILEGL